MVAPGSTSSPTAPLVSCILPTKNRAKYIPQAIRSYQSQTYPHKELIIVDNGNDKTESLIPTDDSTISYNRVKDPKKTGAMRNICAMLASGEFIVHFDSDDWSAPERVTDQVTRLGIHGVVTGYESMFFYDERDDKCYYWHWKQSPKRSALGTSLCYRRVWWRHHPFPEILIGEDLKFFEFACSRAGRLVTTTHARQLMVSRVHDHQTSRKSLTKTGYTPMPKDVLPQAYPCDLTLLAT